MKQKITPVPKAVAKPHTATFPPEPECAAGEGIALIELFAGLRTARLAARCEGMSVVAHLTAEICPFANLVAQKNFYDDDKRAGFSALHVQDVNDISQELIDAWVGCIYSSSLRPLTKVAVMVAGFPCKGTSRCRDTGRAFESRPGLADPQSILFWAIPRIRDQLLVAFEKLAPAGTSPIPLRLIVENVIPDSRSLKEVSQALGVAPIIVQASRQCAAPRDRTFWCNFELRCTESEKFSKRNIKGATYREFLLSPMKHQFQPDLGWKVHAQFPGNFPCILGWVMKKTQPKGETTQHFSTASLSQSVAGQSCHGRQACCSSKISSACGQTATSLALK